MSAKLTPEDLAVIPLRDKPEEKARGFTIARTAEEARTRSAYLPGDVVWAKRPNGQCAEALVLSVHATPHWHVGWMAYYKVRFKGRRGWKRLYSFQIEKGYWEAVRNG